MRFAAAMAMIGIARGDFGRAEEWLRGPLERASDPVGTELLAEQYFYVLVWQKQITRAEQFAGRMLDRYRLLGIQTSMWLERLGDAAFISGDFGAALRRYEESLETDRPETRVLLKLSDVYFCLGDLEKERLYREKIYGTLNPSF